jgi:hypothetical protein
MHLKILKDVFCLSDFVENAEKKSLSEEIIEAYSCYPANF